MDTFQNTSYGTNMKHVTTIRISEMSTTTCWSLWQRMPPRYQLTARRDEPDIKSEERCKTPSSTPRSNRDRIKRSTTSIETKRLPFSDVSATIQRQKQAGGKRFQFPNRKSGYIDHFKTQQKVNSAKVRFSSNPPTSPFSPRERATSAPHFPVTKLDETPTDQLQMPITQTTQDICSEHRATGGRIRVTNSRNTDSRQSVTECDDGFSVISDSKSNMRDSQQRRFNVRETEEGTMYIDNGKVIYFKRSRRDPIHLLKSRASDKNGGFLASIRKEYLKKPNYIAFGPEKCLSTETKMLQHERVYYNQKVGHILDYYSKDDEDRLSIDDLAKYTRHSPRSPRSRTISPRNAKIRKIYISQEMDMQRSQPSPDLLEDPNLNSYIKMNSQSKLHDRNFYLRTPVRPDFHGLTTVDIDNCKCGICRIEMQLSLMQKLGIGYPLGNVREEIDKEEHQVSDQINKAIPKVMQPSPENKAHTESKDEGITISDENTIDGLRDEAERNAVTITVPGMSLDREGTESMIDTARSEAGPETISVEVDLQKPTPDPAKSNTDVSDKTHSEESLTQSSSVTNSNVSLIKSETAVLSSTPG